MEEKGGSRKRTRSEDGELYNCIETYMESGGHPPINFGKYSMGLGLGDQHGAGGLGPLIPNFYVELQSFDFIE